MIPAARLSRRFSSESELDAPVQNDPKALAHEDVIRDGETAVYGGHPRGR